MGIESVYLPKENRNKLMRNVRKDARLHLPIVTLPASDPDFEDVRSLEHEVKRSRLILTSDLAFLRYIKLLEFLGADNAFFATFIKAPPEDNILKMASLSSTAVANGRITQVELISSLAPARMLVQAGACYTEVEEWDEDEAVKQFQSLTVPYSALIQEQFRIDQENSILLSLYLEEKRKERRKGKKEERKHQEFIQKQAASERRQERFKKTVASLPQPVETETSPSLQILPVVDLDTVTEEPIILTDWQLFYTNHRFSDEPHYLSPFLPDTKPGLARQLKEILMREGSTIPIKNTSVIGAVKFHLDDKSRVQRALSLRNRYYHSDWAKVKRGDARIMMKIDPDQQTCIFFAGHRKDIYRNVS